MISHIYQTIKIGDGISKETAFRPYVGDVRDFEVLEENESGYIVAVYCSEEDHLILQDNNLLLLE